MPDSLPHNEKVPEYSSPEAPWFEAYTTLRNLLLDPHWQAAPVKCMAGAVLVTEDLLARRLNMHLKCLLGLLQADREQFYGSTDATTRADRVVEPL